MNLVKSINRPDGYSWRRKTKGCQSHKSMRLNSFFYDSRLEICKILWIIFNWAAEFVYDKTEQIV